MITRKPVGEISGRMPGGIARSMSGGILEGIPREITERTLQGVPQEKKNPEELLENISQSSLKNP